MFKFWLALTLLSTAAFSEGAVAADESNPLADVAKALLQESLSGKGGGGENLGEALIGQLGSMLAGSGGSSGSGGAELLSGIGSLLAASSAGKGGGGFDADTIGNFVDMLAGSGKSGGTGGGDSGGIDMESLIGLASSVMAGQQGRDSGGAGLLNLLPLLLQTTNNQKASGRVHPRAERGVETNTVEDDDHQSPWSMLIPPLWAGLKEQWDNLWRSDAARKLLEESGLGATLSLFLDSEGRFDSDRVMASLENASFRRRWVRGAASFVARWAVYAAKPESRKRIVSMATGTAATLLQSAQVLGEDSFDPTDLPIEETIARLVNVGARRMLGIQNLDSGIYINPAVGYVKKFLGFDDFKSGKKAKGFGITAMLDALARMSPRQVEDRLAEAVSEELIEPTLRVWRAYKFAKRRSNCALNVMCTINRQEEQEDGVSASQRKSKKAPRVGLKPVVTKVTSLAAGWFLSNPSEKLGFWKFYDAIMDEHVCEVKYPGDCLEFHVEDQKATTEYAHSEL